MSIIVSKSGKNARKLARTEMASEAYLQNYIFENPDTLPLHEYKEDLKLLIITREFPTESGPIDALGVDQDGEIYLIETKLYKNPDKRLVLAQVLDYGAALWQNYGDPQEIVSRLQELVSENFDMSLREKLEETFIYDEWDVDEHVEAMKLNVGAGSFRFVVLMDRLEDRLKDLISFMNQNSRFDIFGVELDFYKHEQFEILIPRLFGAEVKKSVGAKSTTSSRRKWDEKTFFADATSLLEPEEVESIRSLYVWSRKMGADLSWGTGVQRGSFNPKFNHVSPRSVFSVYSDGTMKLNFAWLNEPSHSRIYAEQLGNELRNELDSFSIPSDFMNEYVTIPLKKWSAHVSEVTNILERVLFEDTVPPNQTEH